MAKLELKGPLSKAEKPKFSQYAVSICLSRRSYAYLT